MLLSSQLTAANGAAWSEEGVEYCIGNGLLSGNEEGELMLSDGITREQMIKMLCLMPVSSVKEEGAATQYEDISADRWSYPYISRLGGKSIVTGSSFNPTEPVTRQELAATLVNALGFSPKNLTDHDILKERFTDYTSVDKKIYGRVAMAVQYGLITGSERMLRPTDMVTREEACVLIYRGISFYNSMYGEPAPSPEPEKTDPVNTPEPEETAAPDTSDPNTSSQGTAEPEETAKPERPETSTPLVGSSAASLEQAIQWAKNRNADQRFIDVAELYWKYGEITGIRADIMYAQAAKETNFGKYTGQVTPEQNNWAGIKKKGATGDLPEDHEDFATPDDGVRGHFNHMSAYIGLEPTGEPHGRYFSVKTLAWAGTVKTVEELGGKWCPDTTYGFSIIDDFLTPMLNTAVN